MTPGNGKNCRVNRAHRTRTSELMPRARGLGLKIEFVVLVGREGVWHAFRHVDPIAGESGQFVRIVGHQADL